MKPKTIFNQIFGKSEKVRSEKSPTNMSQVRNDDELDRKHETCV